VGETRNTYRILVEKLLGNVATLETETEVKSYF